MNRRRDRRLYSERTGKFHTLCPHAGQSGVTTHVVVKDEICYRCKDCMVFECRFHAKHGDVETILSVAW